MNGKRRCRRALIVPAALCMVLMAGMAFGWEFTMEGSLSWELEAIGQNGTNGFFGKYDVDAGSGIAGAPAGTFAPLNAWLGEQGGGLVSGSDGSWNTQYMSFDMELRMNEALRIRAQYYIGEWNPPADAATGSLVASEYLNDRHPGIQQAMSPGYWNYAFLSAQLPWGTVSLGKRPSEWGTGLSWNGDESRTSESFSITAPYGPFRVALGFYPSRRASSNEYYNPDMDKNNSRVWDATVPNITYRCGALDTGVQFTTVRRHSGGEGRVDTPDNRRTAYTYRDREETYGGVYIKYYPSPIFFNAELTWFDQTNRNRRKDAGGGPAAGVRDTYIEHWRWMTEVSTLAGPMKVSLLYAWFSGGDRRNGSQIDRNGILASDSFANTGLFRPFSYLQVYGYGVGHFVNGSTGNGYVEDASVYGGRVDYSVAANLNVYGSFFWADRASKSGFGWGCITPDIDPADITGYGGAVNMGYGVAGAPSIPDSNLGWEINGGFDWQLLEGLVVNATFAYWQPGKWYKYACVDKGVVNWADPTAANNWGINPNRSIDPIWGMELVVNAEF
ncbi:MAG: hypothetical protein V1792_14420 [Pseudomonadota bacterium]